MTQYISTEFLFLVKITFDNMDNEDINFCNPHVGKVELSSFNEFGPAI